MEFNIILTDFSKKGACVYVFISINCENDGKSLHAPLSEFVAKVLLENIPGIEVFIPYAQKMLVWLLLD